MLALVVGEVSVEVEEVVALRDVVADAVVEHAGEEVLGVPGEVEELRLTGVILPSPETFVSGEFLLFPDTAEEGVLAGVVGDVGRVGGAFLSGENKQTVDFGIVAVLFTSALSLRVNGRLVEVVGTRGDS